MYTFEIKNLVCKKCKGKNCIPPVDPKDGFSSCLFCGANYYPEIDIPHIPVVRTRKKRNKKNDI